MSTRFFTNHGEQTLFKKFQGVFESNPDIAPEEEERDQRLALLMELRQFRQQNPEEFRRIKGLPLRARVGRADAKRAGSTITFIRSQRRDAFYRIRPRSSRREENQNTQKARHQANEPERGCVGVGDQPQRVDLAAIQDAAADAPTPHTAALRDTVRWQSQTENSALPDPHSAFEVEEIALLEAADEFRAPDPKEKALPIYAAHHDHIDAALENSDNRSSPRRSRPRQWTRRKARTSSAPCGISTASPIFRS